MEKKENFTRSVKNELASYPYEKEQLKYILSGFARNGGVFSIGKNPTLYLRTELAKVAKLLYQALKECYGLTPRIAYEQVTRFKKGIAYQVIVSSPDLYQVMEELEVLKDGMERMVPKEGLRKSNFRYLLIGVFLSSGSVNNPSTSKTSYFLEMSFNNKNDALAIKRKLLTFKEEKTMAFKTIKRREKQVLYLKRSDQISVFLSFIGATTAMFSFENARIMKEDININNRLSICDSANYGKTLTTAKKDIDGIKRLLETKPLSLFDQKTQDVIKIRLEHQDFNYREIAEFLTSQGTTISKSGVVHIIASLRDEIEKLDQPRIVPKAAE